MAHIQDRAGTSPSLIRMLGLLADADIKLKAKSNNFIFKITGRLFKQFVQNVFTTVGGTIWLPSAESLNSMSTIELFRVLGHEYVHARDMQKHPILFYLSYCFPQWLAIFGLLGFLGFYSYLFFVFFGFFIFLLKLPSPRLHWEFRAYAAELMMHMKQTGSLDDRYVDELVDEILSPLYHMKWNKSRETIKDWLLIYTEYAILTNTDSTYTKLRSII